MILLIRTFADRQATRHHHPLPVMVTLMIGIRTLRSRDLARILLTNHTNYMATQWSIRDATEQSKGDEGIAARDDGLLGTISTTPQYGCGMPQCIEHRVVVGPVLEGERCP